MLLNAITRLSIMLHRDRRGVTALEYGLIASLIAVAIIGSVKYLATSIETTFSAVADAL